MVYDGLCGCDVGSFLKTVTDYLNEGCLTMEIVIFLMFQTRVLIRTGWDVL